MNFEFTWASELLVSAPDPLVPLVPFVVPPVAPAANVVVAPVLEPAADVELPPAPLAAAPPAALPIGGTGGGDPPAPRLPLKVGLLQFDALSCCAG